MLCAAVESTHLPCCCSRYNWAWGRFDNGDLFTYRQWHAKDSQDIGAWHGEARCRRMASVRTRHNTLSSAAAAAADWLLTGCCCC